MALIQVNSQRTSFNEKNLLNLKSLIPQLQKQFPREKYQLSEFKINGIPVDYLTEDPKLVRPIEEDDIISISFEDISNPYTDMIADLSGLIDKLISQIKLICDSLQEDKMNQNSLAKVIDAVDLFIQSSNYLSVKLITDQDDIADYIPLKELQIHLLSIIKAIRSAYSKEDYIMLADLLEYELRDNLTQWKILILPILKQFAQSQY